MPETAIEPGTSCAINHNPPSRPVTIGAASMNACLLVVPSTGTYGNGVALAGAQVGNTNAIGIIEQLQIPAKHPQSTTPYDKTTDFVAGDPARAIEHIIGRSYWLEGSSLSITKGAKMIGAASGLIASAGAGTTTPVSMLVWVCNKTVATATYVQGKFIGLASVFTA